MKSITITAPDEIFDQTVLALTSEFTGEEADRLEFAKEQLILILGDKIREYARQQIRSQAQATVEATVAAAFEQIAATRPDIQVTIDTV